MCFTETHLDNYITDDVLAIPGYAIIIRKDRAGIGKGLGGGIIYCITETISRIYIYKLIVDLN